MVRVFNVIIIVEALFSHVSVNTLLVSQRLTYIQFVSGSTVAKFFTWVKLCGSSFTKHKSSHKGSRKFQLFQFTELMEKDLFSHASLLVCLYTLFIKFIFQFQTCFLEI